MKNIVSQIHKLLVKKTLTVAAAESCTGGILSGILTSLSGSSKYFKLGVVVYSNEAKQRILKIPAKVIDAEGAVSAKVAGLMAEAVRKTARTDFGIGITGIAGPSGGTDRKPVGTVYIAVASAGKTVCLKRIFKGSRGSIRKQSALKTLELLRENIHRH
ncbi:MAG: CinA family protein [Candidatus Omnitrophica bacterium]|nr:CinA family protein [Candidatus Omnitrophota bacterium]